MSDAYRETRDKIASVREKRLAELVAENAHLRAEIVRLRDPAQGAMDGKKYEILRRTLEVRSVKLMGPRSPFWRCEYCESLNQSPLMFPHKPECVMYPMADSSPWQPIETAPKDGTQILAAGRDFGVATNPFHIVTAQWVASEEAWFERNDLEDEAPLPYLTNWMPLPSAPSTVSSTERRDV